jgi:hypothetical protein
LIGVAVSFNPAVCTAGILAWQRALMSPAAAGAKHARVAERGQGIHNGENFMCKRLLGLHGSGEDQSA